MNFKRRLKIFVLALKDFFMDNYLYHSAALAYISLMSFFSIFVVVFVIVSYIPFDFTNITDLFSRMFPQQSFDYVQFIEHLAKGRTTIGVVGFVMAYYFATNLFRQLNRAILTIINRKEPISKYWLRHLVFIPSLLIILFVLYIVVLSLTWIFSTIRHFITLPSAVKFLNSDWSLFTGYLIDYVVFVIFLFFVYFMYLAKKDRLLPDNIVVISLIEGFVLTLLKYTFSLAYRFLIKSNPLFGTFATVLFFLLWMYLMFGIILYGARVLYYSNIEDLADSNMV